MGHKLKETQKTCTLKINPSLQSEIRAACYLLANQDNSSATDKNVVHSATISHLEFTLEIQSNNFTYEGNPYTDYQQFLHTLIKFLNDKEY